MCTDPHALRLSLPAASVAPSKPCYRGGTASYAKVGSCHLCPCAALVAASRGQKNRAVHTG